MLVLRMASMGIPHGCGSSLAVLRRSLTMLSYRSKMTMRCILFQRAIMSHDIDANTRPDDVTEGF